MLPRIICVNCFFVCYADHRDLHVLTLSVPTPRSSDLGDEEHQAGRRMQAAAQEVHPWTPGVQDRTPGQNEERQDADELEEEAIERHLAGRHARSEEHTSELQSLMRISYTVFGLTKTNTANRVYTVHTEKNKTTI